jgi:hypothetical protein
MITVVTGVHEVMAAIHATLKGRAPSDLAGQSQKKDAAAAKVVVKDDEIVVKKSEIEALFTKLKAVDEALMERLFVVQVAVEDGWAMAKDVAFFKTGACALR